MLALLARYARWLHTGWPAGTVERLPEVGPGGTTSVPGLRVAGDLTGIPLLKLAVASGVEAARAIAAEADLRAGPSAPGAGDVVDVAIVGGGPAGIAAAVEARKLGLSTVVLEAARPFSTIANFPVAKPIYAYPLDLETPGDVRITAEVKEALLDELERQRVAAGIETVVARVTAVERRAGLFDVRTQDERTVRARRVIVAVGRSGDHRRLGVPGEDLGKVSNRLHDPRTHAGQDVLVVGGGDSALEAAIALTLAGARVTLAHRGPAFSRPKAENVEKLERLARDPAAQVAVERPTSERVTTAFTRGMVDGASGAVGSLRLALDTRVVEVRDREVALRGPSGPDEVLKNDAVFTMIGREAPLELFRRSGVTIRGEWTWPSIAGLVVSLLLCTALYLWKDSAGPLHPGAGAFPDDVPARLSALGDAIRSDLHFPVWMRDLRALVADRTTLVGTLATSLKSTSFYYTLVYTLLVVTFGVRRIRRRRTPYVTAQTVTLMLVQAIPLFLLPEVLLPWLGYNGAFAGDGLLARLANELFPLYVKSDAVWPTWGHPRAYWQAYGLVLAWPLFVYNVFSAQPHALWLAISGVQTFVIVPAIVWRWGKGAYCGWICSCGALAETLGDDHRAKMPHGPGWNRLNLVGQVLLALAFALLALRITGWVLGPASWASRLFVLACEGKSATGATVNPFAWKWVVDITLAGIIGVGCYFWLSGRVWCRFACPLAALMHIYARFSRFRIFAEKKRCISCNVCTTVCHQGIDVMSFANKGLPMQDPECVRCSACVSSCPTGTLAFGHLDAAGAPVLDTLSASPVRAAGGRQLPVVS